MQVALFCHFSLSLFSWVATSSLARALQPSLPRRKKTWRFPGKRQLDCGEKFACDVFLPGPRISNVRSMLPKGELRRRREDGRIDEPVSRSSKLPLVTGEISVALGHGLE
jgi:hypothetical protein